MKSFVRHTEIFTAVVLAVVTVVFPPRCTTDIADGGSEAGNARIIGKIIHQDGTPAENVIVRILPSDFDPVKDAPVADSCTDTTAADGIYRFVVVKGRYYSIQAEQLYSRLRGLATEIETVETGDTVTCSLKPPGTVMVLPPVGCDTISGYLYIPGTTYHVHLNETDKYAMLDSVPAGIIPSIYYSSFAGKNPVIIRKNLEVISGDTVTVPWQNWEYSKKLILNTSSSGADVHGDVYGFPVLVRLSANTFDFSQAKTMGEDIRFTSSSGKVLSHEIEQWDSVKQRASIWVNVDTVHGNDNTQFIMMYWGNPDANGMSNSNAVFDTADGFAGIWHLNNKTRDSTRDATWNHFNGTSPDSAAPQVAQGIIGNCNEFDGIDDFITMPNTAAGKLNFPEDGYFTVSAWVKIDSLDGTPHLIVSKGYSRYFMRFTYFPSNSPLWEFSEFNTVGSWEACTTSALSRQWSLLTGVRMGSKQMFYFNGVPVDSIPNIYIADSLTINTSYDLSIGRFLEIINLPNDTAGYCFFKGAIDEVRIDRAARDPNWIRLCFMNQKADNQLIEFK